MTTVLSPSLISGEKAKQLFAFLEAQKDVAVWKKGQTFRFADNTTFEFSHDVVRRQRKEGKEGVRYEFISQKELGQGAMGVVYRVAATMSIDENNINFKQYGSIKENGELKDRAMKIQEHGPVHNPLDAVSTEYELSKKADHLAIKAPTIQGNTSYLVMKEFKGRELFDILEDDNSRINVLTLQQRVELSQALLKALKEQVTDKGLLHRDIKPENIRVDMTSPITVNILDYGLSTSAVNPDNKPVGTPLYAAPEIWSRGKQTAKLDVFSMARILAVIWHGEDDSYYWKNAPVFEFQSNAFNVKLDTLFSGIRGLGKQNKAIIQTTLQNMVKVNLNDNPDLNIEGRISVEQAIERFSQIKLPQIPAAVVNPIINPNSVKASKVAITPAGKKQIDVIFQHITALSLHATKLKGREKHEAAEELQALAHALTIRTVAFQRDTLQAMSIDDYKRKVIPYTEDCQNLISKTKESPTLKTHRNSKYILANIALAIVGLGVIYLVAAACTTPYRGSFLFFNQTKSSKLVDTVGEKLGDFNNEICREARVF